METSIIKYEKHFIVSLKKGIIISISHQWWLLLQKILQDKDCPAFVSINWGLYNRFEIESVIPADQNENIVESLISWCSQDKKEKVRDIIRIRRQEWKKVNEKIILNIIETIWK